MTQHTANVPTIDSKNAFTQYCASCHTHKSSLWLHHSVSFQSVTWSVLCFLTHFDCSFLFCLFSFRRREEDTLISLHEQLYFNPDRHFEWRKYTRQLHTASCAWWNKNSLGLSLLCVQDTDRHTWALCNTAGGSKGRDSAVDALEQQRNLEHALCLTGLLPRSGVSTSHSSEQKTDRAHERGDKQSLWDIPTPVQQQGGKSSLRIAGFEHSD